ncbi:MAG: carbohydrate ABC transporter permease [Spirochaetales bacterium]|jgi:putative aldouronate transport system permease protein|nr:carbohydrate ABC transporter permease [Spirochaetales bacterium]
MVDFRTRQDRIFDAVNVTLLTLLLFVVAYPVYFVIIASISSPTHVSLGNVVLWPRGVNLEAYKYIFSDRRIMLGYRNSLFYASGLTVFSLVLTLPAAYAVSRKDLKGRNVMMLYMVFTMYFSGGMIPYYVLIRKLGLVDNVLVLMLPGAVSIFNIIIARTFFIQNVPDEVLESAKMDGCTNTRFFIQIVLPLSPAVIAIIVLFNVVGSWNSFFDALLFINDMKKQPLQMVLRRILLLGGNLSGGDDLSWMTPEEIARRTYLRDLLQYGIIVVAVAPLLMLYPFIQKHFVRGIMVGSIKG